MTDSTSTVERRKRSGTRWGLWFIGLLLLIGFIWFFFGRSDPRPVADIPVVEPVAQVGIPVAPASAPLGEPASAPPSETAVATVVVVPGGIPGTAGTTGATGATGTSGTPGTAGASSTPGAPATDPAIYASTQDKLALVGREAAFSAVKVARIVGPKTFTVASGSDELIVMIDADLSQGVGSQGKIDIGTAVTLQGSFQRLQQEEINQIASNRFRDLTEAEREALRKIPVYLHATRFGKIN